MIKKNSIYSLNKKNPDAIVYSSATGKPVFVTREDFPNEEEFLAFKKWSDENFHSEEKLDHRESNRTVSAENISDAAFATPAIDIEMERQQEQEDRRKMASDMVVKLKDKLTETQFRRLWMYYIDGMTVDEIGRIEGIRHQNISKSIGSAMKKIKKFFP